MSGGGEGDRPGVSGVGTSGDRRPLVKLRCINAALLNLKDERIAMVAMVVDERLPKIVMFEGEPFLLMPGSSHAYRQEKPYRADALVIEVTK